MTVPLKVQLAVATSQPSSHLPALKYLLQEGCPFDAAELANEAAAGGNVELMKWLGTAHDVTYQSKSVNVAALYGHEAALRYLVTTQGCVADVNTWAFALRSGSFQALQCMLEHCSEHLQPQLYEEVCRLYPTSIKGLELIRWLHEPAHCPWDIMTLARRATVSQNLEVLVYVKQQGMVWSPGQLTTLLQYGGTAPGYHGSLSLQWLRDEGAAWPQVLGWLDEDWGYTTIWSDTAVEWARAQGVCRGLQALRLVHFVVMRLVGCSAQADMVCFFRCLRCVAQAALLLYLMPTR